MIRGGPEENALKHGASIATKDYGGYRASKFHTSATALVAQVSTNHRKMPRMLNEQTETKKISLLGQGSSDR